MVKEKGQDTMGSSHLPWTACLSCFEKLMQLISVLNPSYLGSLLEPPNPGYNQFRFQENRSGRGKGEVDSQELDAIIGPMSRGHQVVTGPPVPNLPGLAA